MSHFYRVFLAIASLSLWSTQASQSRAFDCSKAYSQTEKTICSNPSLVTLDNRMARYYVKALGGISPKNRKTLRKSQHNWLKSRNSCKKNISCLKGYYTNWIVQYHKFAAQLAAKNKASGKKKKASGAVKKSRTKTGSRTKTRAKTRARATQGRARKKAQVQKVSSPAEIESVAKPTVLQDNL